MTARAPARGSRRPAAEPAAPADPRRERRQKLLAATIVPLVFLLALEGVARVAEPRHATVEVAGTRAPSWLASDPSISATFDQLERVANYDLGNVMKFWEFYRRDRELHYRLLPNLDAWTVNTIAPREIAERSRWHLTSNAQGFRGRELPAAPLPAGQRLVVCLGDSSTYGWGVEEKDAYPARLARELGADGPGWTVINLGHPGFTSFQGRLLAERVAALRPDTVTISYGTNDASVAGLPDADLYRSDHSALARVAGVAEHLALYRVLQRVVLPLKRRAAGGALVERVSIPDYERNLAAIVTAVQRAGARPVFLLVGNARGYAEAMTRVARATATPLVVNDQLAGYALPDVREGRAYATEAAAVRARLGPWIDQHPDYLLFVDNTHPNEIGHDLIAKRLATVVLGHAPGK